MNDLTLYWLEQKTSKKNYKFSMEKNAAPLLFPMLARGAKAIINWGLKRGVPGASKATQQLTKPQAMLSKDWWKAQVDPRSMGQTIMSTVKNPWGSFSQQFGLRNKASEAFLKDMQRSNLTHVRDWATTKMHPDHLKSFGEMGKLDKLGLGFGGLVTASAIPTIGDVFQKAQSGQMGKLEALGHIGSEAAYLMGGPGLIGAGIGMSGALPAAGRFLGGTPSTYRPHSVWNPMHVPYSNYY